MARGNEVLRNVYDEDGNFLKVEQGGIAGYQVYYVESTGNSTYEKENIASWEDTSKTFNLYNSGVASLTVEFNDSGIIYTIASGEEKGAITLKEEIIKVDIVGTGDFQLLLRG